MLAGEQIGSGYFVRIRGKWASLWSIAQRGALVRAVMLR